MFDWLDKKPDHPMYSVEEAVKLLADLPKDKPDKALEEITGWLASVKDTPGFKPEARAGVIKFLDETAQPLERKEMAAYLAEPHLREAHGKHLWQTELEFWSRAAEAYAVCVSEIQALGKGAPVTLKDDLPVLAARAVRALACRMKLMMMRYEPVDETLGKSLHRLYSLSEAGGFVTERIHTYPAEAVHSTVQIEFLKALMLETAYTENMAPAEIELAFRTVSRYAVSCLFGTEPAAGCNFVVDLSRPAAPRHVTGGEATSATLRYFGAAPALPKLEEMAKQNEQGLLTAEQRLGEEFSPGQKVTVLKHLMVYWGPNPPQPPKVRVKISGELSVVHGYGTICKYVTHIEASAGEVTEDMDVKIKKKKGLEITEEEIEDPPETWMEEDASDWSVGAVVPQNAGKWVAVGSLCAIKPPAGSAWWAGVVRRLHSDAHNKISASIEVIARKPVALWLRVLGQGDTSVANWETTSGSFAYEYLHAIVLTDHAKAGERPVLVVEKNSFVPGHFYEMMMGDKSRFLRLVEFLEQGEDYDMGSFEWQQAPKG
ncbi:MAG: hypothetical protein HYU77_15535 [Betaproteobacteria bacterium]|nr:hypothetical protein [Betaproteobacteria bacterium]